MNNTKLVSFEFNNFQIKHQRNGTCYLTIPFICKTRNIFLLNKDDFVKLDTKNKIKIYYDNSIKVYIKKSEKGKSYKYIGNDKYIIIIKELNDDTVDNYLIDDDYESDGTILMSDTD